MAYACMLLVWIEVNYSIWYRLVGFYDIYDIFLYRVRSLCLRGLVSDAD